MSLRLTRMLVAGSLLLALPAALLAAPLTGRWERRAPMRMARSEVAVGRSSVRGRRRDHAGRLPE